MELSDITFTGLVRLELGPLFPRFPCFGGIDVTFLDKPFIDFSLKAVSFNVMNLGVDELNMTGSLPSPLLPLLKYLFVSIGELYLEINFVFPDHLPSQVPHPYRSGPGC